MASRDELFETKKKAEFEANVFNSRQFNSDNDFEVNEVISAFSFFEFQRREFMNIIAAALQANQRDQDFFDSSFPPNDGAEQNQNSNVKPWIFEDIDFFDLDEKMSENAIFIVDRHVFYRDVYVFVDRFEDMTSLRKKNRLRIVIPQCLRKSAIIWHIIELSEMKKAYFRTATMTQWKTAFIIRFKERASIALIKLQIIRYIIADAKTKKDPRMIVQNIFRHAKTIHLNSVHNQLIMTWNALNCEFRFQISKPTSIIIIKHFLHDLDSHAGIWQEIIKRKFNNSSDFEITKRTIYDKQLSSFRWKTKHRDFF